MVYWWDLDQIQDYICKEAVTGITDRAFSTLTSSAQKGRLNSYINTGQHKENTVELLVNSHDLNLIIT